jgi:hypothetical protein
MTDSNSDAYETSEFSIYEVLYMGHAGLTFYVESLFDSQRLTDPFDLIAELEERMGTPLALGGESDM